MNMDKKKHEFRLVLTEISNEYKIIEKIKRITKIDDQNAILKSCIKIAYEQYYQKMEKDLK